MKRVQTVKATVEAGAAHRNARFHRLASVVAMAVLLLPVAPATAADTLELPGLDGGRLSEGDLQRGSHIVVFWASWAPRGRDVVERVNALADRWGSRANVITVNFQEDEATVRSFLQGKSLKTKVYLDGRGDLSKKYRVNSAPWLLILKNGNIAFSEKLPQDADTFVNQVLG